MRGVPITSSKNEGRTWKEKNKRKRKDSRRLSASLSLHFAFASLRFTSSSFPALFILDSPLHPLLTSRIAFSRRAATRIEAQRRPLGSWASNLSRRHTNRHRQANHIDCSYRNPRCANLTACAHISRSIASKGFLSPLLLCSSSDPHSNARIAFVTIQVNKSPPATSRRHTCKTAKQQQQQQFDCILLSFLVSLGTNARIHLLVT